MSQTELYWSDADLYQCMLFRTPVEVWLNGELEEAGAILEGYSDNVIKVGGAYYFRKMCQIKRMTRGI
jgi:hypothetical protein